MQKIKPVDKTFPVFHSAIWSMQLKLVAFEPISHDVRGGYPDPRPSLLY